MPCGSTGEASSLGREEYLEVIKTAIDEAAGRTQILAGAGGNNTAATAELVREVAALKPDAILSVAPCYNKPTQEGLKAHFKAVSAAADTVPVVLYNIPGRTGVNMQPQTIISIAKECRNVIGVKEASGSLDQVSEIVRLANAAAGEIPQGFAVIYYAFVIKFMFKLRRTKIFPFLFFKIFTKIRKTSFCCNYCSLFNFSVWTMNRDKAI